MPYRNNPVPRLAGIERLRIVIVICCGIRFGIPAALRNVGGHIDTAGILRHLCPLRRLRIAFCVLCRICLTRLVLQVEQSVFYILQAAAMELYPCTAQRRIFICTGILLQYIADIGTVYVHFSYCSVHLRACRTFEVNEHRIAGSLVESACKVSGNLRKINGHPE